MLNSPSKKTRPEVSENQAASILDADSLTKKI